MEMLWDYECERCRSPFEAYAEPEQKIVACPVCGEGRASRVFLRMASLPGRNKGVYPRFDVQLGITLESSQHMERVAKARGLVPVGADDFNRSRNNAHAGVEPDGPSDELVEIAKRSWDDVKYGRAEPEPEGPPPELPPCDVLDLSEAPSIKSE